MQPRQLDIQLLVVFEALLSERNVTRAAERVNLTQSATSKALARLREVLGDPLFLRSKGGVLPTHRALELAPRIRQTLEAARELLDPNAAFDPSQATTTFNIAASDYITFVVLPVLLPLLVELAPHVRLTVHDLDRFTAEELLLSGQVDLALASVSRVSLPLKRRELFHDEYVCIGRAGHPAMKGRVSLARFVATGHLVIPRQNGGGMSVVDDALAQQSLERDVVVTVPHYLGIPAILGSTDLLATVPARIGNHLSRHFPIGMCPHPLPLSPFVVSQIWHSRTNSSPSHQWLRGTIGEICAGIRAPEPSSGS